jgi:hypothetical protein
MPYRLEKVAAKLCEARRPGQVRATNADNSAGAMSFAPRDDLFWRDELVRREEDARPWLNG